MNVPQTGITSGSIIFSSKEQSLKLHLYGKRDAVQRIVLCGRPQNNFMTACILIAQRSIEKFKLRTETV